MKPQQWSAEDWQRFSLHAAPEAIEDALNRVRVDIRRAQLAEEKLVDLLVHRQMQVQRRQPWCDGRHPTCGHPGPAPIYPPPPNRV